MPKSSHIHKLVRKNIGRNKPYIVFACIKDGCSYYIASNLAVNKQSLCNKCDTPFKLNKKDVELYAKPLCNDCKGTVKPEFSKLQLARRKNVKQTVEESKEDLLELLTNFDFSKLDK